jgi:hypothetical protein
MPRGTTAKVLDRAAHVYYMLVKKKCITTNAVMKEFGLSRTQALHVLKLMVEEEGAVEVVMGRISIWCIDKKSAVQLIRRLKAELVRLVGSRRYITVKKALELISQDRRARSIFGRIIPLGRPTTAAFGAVSVLLRATYGEPIRRSTYYTINQNMDINIEIRSNKDAGTTEKGAKEAGRKNKYKSELVLTSFHLPLQMLRVLDRYAAMKNMKRSEVVRTAVQRMLKKMKKD